MMSEQTKGSCLCGKIQFVVRGPYSVFHLCHCSRCRKDSGSAHASKIFTAPENIEWLDGMEFIKRYDLPTAERFAKNFCTECGSPVPYLSRDGKFLIGELKLILSNFQRNPKRKMLCLPDFSSCHCLKHPP